MGPGRTCEGAGAGQGRARPSCQRCAATRGTCLLLPPSPLSLSPALCENPALLLRILAGVARPLALKDGKARACAGGEPLSGVRGGFAPPAPGLRSDQLSITAASGVTRGRVPMNPMAPISPEPPQTQPCRLHGAGDGWWPGRVSLRSGGTCVRARSRGATVAGRGLMRCLQTPPRPPAACWLIPDLRGLADPVGFLSQIPASTCFPRQCPCLFGIGFLKNFKAKQHTKKKKKLKKSASRPLCGSAPPLAGQHRCCLPPRLSLGYGSGAARGWDGAGWLPPGRRSVHGLAPSRGSGAVAVALRNVCRKLAASRGPVRDLCSPSSLCHPPPVTPRPRAGASAWGAWASPRALPETPGLGR